MIIVLTDAVVLHFTRGGRAHCHLSPTNRREAGNRLLVSAGADSTEMGGAEGGNTEWLSKKPNKFDGEEEQQRQTEDFSIRGTEAVVSG